MSETMPRFTPPDSEITGQHRAQALRRVNNNVGARAARAFWEWSKSFLIAVALFLFIRTFFVEAFKIPSGSMERTLLVGDFLLVNKLVYGAEVPFAGVRLPALSQPQRREVLVFQYPKDPSKNYVKRLVGVPGDTLAMRDGQLFVNGDSQAEQYVSHTEPDSDPSGSEFGWQRRFLVNTADATGAEHPSRNNWGPLVVPEGNYFVLGDNRDNSADSRYWGFVPDSLVRGRPIFVYYSYAPDSAHRFAWLTDIRWQRLGEWIR